MKKNSKKLPVFKKDIKDFLLSEEGKITKKDIAKIGMSLAMLSMIFTPTQGFGQATHSNYFTESGTGAHMSHASHASHGSHGSHGSHSSGGWC